MSLAETRYAILESVSEMDVIQTKEVLDYIDRMQKMNDEKIIYSNFKKNAMDEIMAALKEA